MAASGAKTGFGSALQLSDGGGTPVYTSIAEVVSISGPSLSRTMIDVTHMMSDNGAKEYLAGIISGGEVRMMCNFIPTNATQLDLITNSQDITEAGGFASTDMLRKYRLILGDTGAGLTATVSTTTWTTATHNWNTAQPVRFTTSGTLPSNVTVGTIYFARRLSSTTFSIHANEADALSGSNAISSSGGSGTHTVNSGFMFLFKANISGITPTVPMDDRITAEVTFQINDLPTTED